MRFIYTYIILLILTGCATIGENSESAIGTSALDIQESKSELNLIITYNASVTIMSKDTSQTLKDIKMSFSKFNGYVINERVSDNYLNITYKIRTEEINNFINILTSNYNLRSTNIYSTDITNDFFDTQIRLENSKKARERFIQLLDEANTVAEIIEIEKELSRINEDIDILEGQMNRLENLKDYSEISIRINKEATPGPLGWIFYGLYKAVTWLFVW